MTRRIFAMVGVLLGAAASARAGRRVGVVVNGEAALGPGLAAEVASWLSHHGFEPVESPLPADAVNALVDCFVLGDLSCAYEVVEKRATSDELVYVVATPVGHATQVAGATQVEATWFADGVEPAQEPGTCASCNDARLRSSVDDMLARLAHRVPAPSPPVPAPPTPVRIAPSPPAAAPTTAAPPAAPPPATAPESTTATSATVGAADEPRRWHAGLSLGVEVPRGALDPGPLLGGRGTFALDPAGTWLVHIAVDWAELGRDASASLSPTWFPRSVGQLDQRADLVTIAAGGSVGVARWGRMALRAGLSAGVQLSRTRFAAFGMSQVQDAAAPVATIEAMLVGPVGPITWRGVIGWRESRRDLGVANGYGEEVTSGAIVAIGADW